MISLKNAPVGKVYSTGELCRFLGVSVRVRFIEECLDIHPIMRSNMAVYWGDEQLRDILKAMGEYFSKRANDE